MQSIRTKIQMALPAERHDPRNALAALFLAGTGNFLRSAEMEYVSLVVQEHLAHDCIERLGEVGTVQVRTCEQWTAVRSKRLPPVVQLASVSCNHWCSVRGLALSH